LKIFQEELKKNSSITELSKARELFDRTFNEYNLVLRTLQNELGDPYTIIETGSGNDYKNLLSSWKIGIISSFDNNKGIWPAYTLKLTSQYYFLSIKEDNEKQEEIFKSSINDVDWSEMKKFVRNYFLKRIDQLK
jgi:hypothetical protein